MKEILGGAGALGAEHAGDRTGQHRLHGPELRQASPGLRSGLLNVGLHHATHSQRLQSRPSVQQCRPVAAVTLVSLLACLLWHHCGAFIVYACSGCPAIYPPVWCSAHAVSCAQAAPLHSISRPCRGGLCKVLHGTACMASRAQVIQPVPKYADGDVRGQDPECKAALDCLNDAAPNDQVRAALLLRSGPVPCSHALMLHAW